MLKNNNILIGKNDSNEAIILLDKVCRHGLVTGASGSGKTITLKVLAESLSQAGVPVLITDVKGDLAGISVMGEMNENIQKRVDKLELEDFKVSSFPTVFFDLYGEQGLPIKTTVNELGPRILSHMLSLTDTQEGVLTLCFKIAKDQNIVINNLNELRIFLNNVGEKRKDYSLSYGNITIQSIGTIQRAILSLQEEDGDLFFGNTSFDIKDLIHFDTTNGYGLVNILHSVKLFNNPTLYSSILIWILNSLYNNLPEVGEVNKPKLVVFLDEAHLLFNDIPSHLLKQLIQIVKLIRSKGVGLFFISQTPNDIPQDIAAQLGNRIQHVLRSYTQNDDKMIKSVGESFRENKDLNIIETIKTLGTGEAVISVLDDHGEPTIVDKFTILPPQSKIGTIDDALRQNLINNSWLNNKYTNVLMNNQVQPTTQISQPTVNQPVQVQAPQASDQKKFELPDTDARRLNTVDDKPQNKKEAKKETKKKSSMEKKIINKFENKIASKIVNSFFK